MTYAKFCELLPVLDCDRSRKAIWMRMKPTDKKQVALTVLLGRHRIDPRLQNTVGLKNVLYFLSMVGRGSLEEKLKST